MRLWFTLALCCLAIAALIGTLLRLIYVVEMPWLLFERWEHAHSHVAMLGWVFTGLFVAMLDQSTVVPSRGPRIWFALALLAVAGMLITFPLQGYGPLSIVFSAVHMLAGYGLAVSTWKRTTGWPAAGSRLLARIALCMLVLSTLGVWAIGPIMAAGAGRSELYHWSIQFFLHFQLNGWFWFGAMAIGSRWAEAHGVPVRLDRLTTALWLSSCVLTYALVIAWSERYLGIIIINAVGVLLQFWAAWRTLVAMRKARLQALVRTTPWMRACIGLVMAAMSVKITIQAALCWPVLADVALTLRNYIIGFIHLNTLGVVTSMLFAYALLRGWFDERRISVRVGLSLFCAGVILSELMLFLQGTLLWAGQGLMPGYFWMQLLASVPIPLGVIALLIHLVRRSSSGSAGVFSARA